MNDELYQQLLELYEELPNEAVRDLDSRLILLLIAELGDTERAAELFAIAKKSLNEK